MGGLAFPGNFFLLFPPPGMKVHHHPRAAILILISGGDARLRTGRPRSPLNTFRPGLALCSPPPLPISLRLLILSGAGAFQRLEGNRRGGEERDISALFTTFLEKVGKEGRGGQDSGEVLQLAPPSISVSLFPLPGAVVEGVKSERNGAAGGATFVFPLSSPSITWTKIRRF